MRNRGGIQGVASSPILVGAVTVLVVIVAVFFAYNANNGLPFVSTYDLKARVPNADALVKGNDVRIGGTLVGTVKSVVPVQLSDGRTAAELSLSLDKSAEPIPVNSTIMIRPKSALGLKFLQITPGDSSKGFAAGSTIPLKAARPEPVDIDQFFSMFDEPTREAIRQSQAGFGTALAGRGPQLNEAFAAARNLVLSADTPLRILAAPSTNFAGFWRALEDLSATVAPVAETQANLFVALDSTFAAFARVSRPYIQETISKGPETLDAANEDLPALRPFLRDSQRFFTALKPGAKALGDTSPVIAASLHAGVPVLNASPVLNNQLAPTAQALVDFQNSPGVFNGLERLTQLNHLLEPALKFIAPAQTTCNYVTLAFRNLTLSSGGNNGIGGWLNFISFVPPEGANSESGPASAPANGSSGAERKNHLHFNPFPNTASPGQPESCAAGNEVYEAGKTVIGNPPGRITTKTDRQLKGEEE
jgi:phospholipid/cholesterol/gamma-HCH transport system substrate-binding protein